MSVFGKEIAVIGSTVFRGACMARRKGFAFSLFSDMLSQAFDIQPTMKPAKIYTMIDEKLATWPAELLDTRPFLQLLVGVQPIGEMGDRLVSMEPEHLRRQTFVALRKVLVTLAEIKPVVLLLDDMQWIDPISADLLLFLSNLMVSHPVLIVAAQRSTETASSEKTLAQTRDIHPDRSIHLSVQPLSVDESYLLLEEFLATANMPEEINQLIVQQSGGNPYFIEEFVRMLLEQDYLRFNRGQLEVNQTFEINELAIPTSLETLIRARFDALPSSARKILQAAAVISQNFDAKLLEIVSMQDDVDNYLLVLQNRGMLVQSEDSGTWSFSHPLIEMIVYMAILRVQRNILHQRTAQALENQWAGSETEHAEDLAYHYRRAEVYDKALYYHIIAGERAAFRHANEAALAQFEQASELLSALPEISDELRWRTISGLGEVYQFVGKFDESVAALTSGLDLISSPKLSLDQRAGLLRRLGESMRKQGEYDEANKQFEEAISMLSTITNRAAEAEMARILARLGWSYFMQANLKKAQESGLRALEYAQKAENLSALAMAENLLGGVFYRQGELTQAAEHTEQAMVHWDKMGYSWGVAVALSNLGILEVAAGKFQAALDAFRKSLELRQEMGDVEGVAITLNNLASLIREQGDMALAESHYRDCLAVAKPFQLAWQTANATMGLSTTLFYQGKIDEAEAMLHEGIAMAQEINARDLSSEMERYMAEILIVRRDYKAALATAEGAAHLAEEIGNKLMASGAWRVVAKSQLADGDAKRALESLDMAWQALKEVDDELESGRVHAQACAIYKAVGDQVRSEEHHQAAKDIFVRLGAARDLAVL
jgi:tetratricopeptide (TPR) repeat protein